MRQFLGGVGTAITTTEGILVYPIQVMNKKRKVVSLIMYSADDGKTWRFANGMTDPGCTEPVVLEWEGKLIMNTRVDVGYRKVYESTDMGETWREVVGTLSRVWGNSPTREGPGSQSSFIPVTIGGKRVMLFTHPLNFKGRWERDRLHLWLTDNNRIFDVGQISVGSENAAYSSLLYKDDKLYCLHETNLQEKYSLVFVRLIDELNLIKSVVASWVAQDNYFSHICTPTDPQSPPRENGCGAPFPTAGLVGFLSESVEEGVWHDVYHCMGANVINAEKVPGGFKFKGGGGGAQWPVGRQGQNQLYHFANYMFTLVATVSVNELPADDSATPLLGVSLDDSGEHKLLGLSYGSNKRWIPIYGKRHVSSTQLLVPNKTYQVVLTYQDGVGSVYVDGEPLEESGKKLPGISKEGIKVSHFYIGGYGSRRMRSDSHVTVTNVLLYNRQLNQNEVKTVFLNRN
ncbi:trans-sialidase, partial [Trypanosoma theileri]